MKPVIRYRSQLLFRKSYKPSRNVKIRPVPRLNYEIYAPRAGPEMKQHECKTN